MNSIEEKLWNYIDGSCTLQERQAIAMLIEQDEVYRKKYDELLTLNQEFSTMEVDEPSMAFTYNVMEAIRTEKAMQPLKSAINKRIILSIAAFFILTISVLVVMILSKVNWHWGNSSALDVTVPVPTQIAANVTHVNSFFSGPLLKGFLFFDIVIGLFLLDNYFRKKHLYGR
ncbi:hypothetical protein FPZ43_06235 [Mucilaginibacter pallidiroseus]|uniref:Uncharacterized protein n=1 Tax=Mucilaginibacter pallidiroseus TaxID=2599295 RepID=A0A563UGP5_9SPHI|nr:hypothetical protein [Mucilaginibacter pallidiroseus]TWR30534.1 hypothetical protein FPZ43_06235 [Mucilaginibacter pallidiroseus]